MPCDDIRRASVGDEGDAQNWLQRKWKYKDLKTSWFASARYLTLVVVYQNKSSVTEMSITKQVFIEAVVLETALRLAIQRAQTRGSSSATSSFRWSFKYVSTSVMTYA